MILISFFIFTKNILEKKPIKVFNNGIMQRDFTYIDDIINGIRSSIFKETLVDVTNHEGVWFMDCLFG